MWTKSTHRFSSKLVIAVIALTFGICWSIGMLTIPGFLFLCWWYSWSVSGSFARHLVDFACLRDWFIIFFKVENDILVFFTLFGKIDVRLLICFQKWRFDKWQTSRNYAILKEIKLVRDLEKLSTWALIVCKSFKTLALN